MCKFSKTLHSMHQTRNSSKLLSIMFMGTYKSRKYCLFIAEKEIYFYLTLNTWCHSFKWQNLHHRFVIWSNFLIITHILFALGYTEHFYIHIYNCSHINPNSPCWFIVVELSVVFLWIATHHFTSHEICFSLIIKMRQHNQFR